MNDFSYDMLDLLKKYDGDTQAALLQEKKPQCLYAFSPLRENLFEWVDIKREDRILQIGSDYGSYTGLLAKRAGEVVVLDTRDENLEVNRLRHGGLENIYYISSPLSGPSGRFAALDETPESGNWRAYKPAFGGGATAGERMNRPFDYVVMAGFLEQYDKEDAKAVLAFASRFLRPGGMLLAAAENEMGVRYLMGARPYRTAFLETEFRGMMEELAEKDGGHAAMYYPVPDYRYPAVIFSDAYLPQAGEVTNLSARLEEPGFWYGNEDEMMAKACRNGMFSKLTNSFLGVWEKGKR